MAPTTAPLLPTAAVAVAACFPTSLAVRLTVAASASHKSSNRKLRAPLLRRTLLLASRQLRVSCSKQEHGPADSTEGAPEACAASMRVGESEDYAALPSSSEVLRGGSSSAVIEFNPPSDLEYLQELVAIQQTGPKAIGFFGTRNMGYLYQQLIEILSYAMVLTKNHIYTSGATGTNAAVIRGALRAEKPDLLTVVLPQSLSKQPSESQELLKQVKNVIEMPENDGMTLMESSRICNDEIVSRVQQVICFAFHDSHLLMETCSKATAMRKIVTLFYLD
eukprot:jgi/Chlat1/3096/Chrsp21S03334